MLPVVSVAEMRAVDEEARATVPTAVLVERAGTALATVAIDMLGGAYGKRVTVLTGRGNNGADGAVAAGVLTRRGAAVEIVAVDRHPDRIGDRADLVIDAALGTGFHGSFDAPAVPDATAVLACDIPSGVDGDTGEARGRPLAARRTVTFGAYKPGLLQGAGPELAGAVTVADIGLDCSRAAIALVQDVDVRLWVPARPRESHKWCSAVFVVAGSPGMTGAAAMCARAAARAGAGMVRLGVPGAELGEVPAGEAVGQKLPAAGWAQEVLEAARRCAAVVVGPGLGRSGTTGAEVRRLVERCPVPVVVDADGLFALGDATQAAAVVAARETGSGRAPAAGGGSGSGSDPAPGPASASGSGPDLGSGPGPGSRLGPGSTSGAHRPADVVFTPHDGEYRRIMGTAPGADRVAAARRLAAACGVVALVKGSTTAVCGPTGTTMLSTSGSSRLATAGTGDVLSGVIAAFVARGAGPVEAAAAAAHAHGRAAGLGLAVGLVAGDLPELVARWLSDAPG